MITIMENSVGERMCKSSPALRMTSSTSPLVLTRTPTARDSRHGIPLACTITALTTSLLPTATITMRPQSNKSSTLFSSANHPPYPELPPPAQHKEEAEEKPEFDAVQQRDTGAEAGVSEEERQ